MGFNLEDFLPYMLNQAAEEASTAFQKNYRERYGMLRTEWRVLFHLGVYGGMTARTICDMASIHKTKISRAVSALEKKRYLKRETDLNDRRMEHLKLTPLGIIVFKDLRTAAETYDKMLAEKFTADELIQLRKSLKKLVSK